MGAIHALEPLNQQVEIDDACYKKQAYGAFQEHYHVSQLWSP
jgi:hypothetical protein